MEPLSGYDHIVVCFSGGKDSVACVLSLLEDGADPDRMELWHHCIDGAPGSPHFMDWPSTPAYCRAFSKLLGIPLHYSWREGGFMREMLRDGTPTAPCRWELPEGGTGIAGGKGPPGTRLKFPQISADLSVRYCSAYLKCDCARRALSNQERFRNSRTLVVTGERAQESSNRARYKVFEPDMTDARKGKLKRHIDHYRPVHAWQEDRVWSAMRNAGIVPHPAYRLGWSRLSCMTCIFGDRNQWASVQAIAPERFAAIADLEHRFGCTIRRNTDIGTFTSGGRAYGAMDPAVLTLALSEDYDENLATDNWVLPAGAFRDGGGPT